MELESIHDETEYKQQCLIDHVETKLDKAFDHDESKILDIFQEILLNADLELLHWS